MYWLVVAPVTAVRTSLIFTAGATLTFSVDVADCSVPPGHPYAALAVSAVPAPVVDGATTRNVALTLWPVETWLNAVPEVELTVQPPGAARLSCTAVAAWTPVFVKVAVTVAAWPGEYVVGPLTLTAVLGGS